MASYAQELGKNVRKCNDIRDYTTMGMF